MRKAPVVAFVNFVVPQDVGHIARTQQPQVLIGPSDQREDLVSRHGVVLQIGTKEVCLVAVNEEEVHVGPSESVMDEFAAGVHRVELHGWGQGVAWIQAEMRLKVLHRLFDAGQVRFEEEKI